MANNLPSIPGLLELVQAIPGLEGVPRLSKYSSEFFFPLMFTLMMAVALLVVSFGRDWAGRSPARRAFGILLDLTMLAAILGTAVVYLIEHEQVCLIDEITGERARLMAETAARAAEYREIFGIDPVEEFPDCQSNLGNWILPFLLASLAVFFIYIVKAWGFPIIAVAIVIGLYTVLSSAAWYFEWSGNRYLTTSIGTESDGVRNYSAGVIGARNAIIQESNSILGRFLSVIVNIVFPYVVLGALFVASAGGQSLIKLAFRVTRSLRGGPAHAAIVGSATFGTVSGAPVVNVLGTGTLTIPMMMRTGFKPTFAGGVEAAASSGGQIMPPVMGIAAFVLAALSTVPYSQVIVAAFLPALAYFFSLFLTVVFEARRTGMAALGRDSGDHELTRRDWTNLLMIAGPILVILVLLLSTKDGIGTGVLAFCRRIRSGLRGSASLVSRGREERGRRSGFGGFLGRRPADRPAVPRSGDPARPGAGDPRPRRRRAGDRTALPAARRRCGHRRLHQLHEHHRDPDHRHPELAQDDFDLQPVRP